MTDTPAVLEQLFAINRGLGQVQGAVEASIGSIRRLDEGMADLRSDVQALSARVAALEGRRKPPQSGKAVMIRLALAAIPPVGGLAFFWPLLMRWLGISPLPPTGH